VFWVISVYFNIRNTLPKFGTFLLGHPVYTYLFIVVCFIAHMKTFHSCYRINTKLKHKELLKLRKQRKNEHSNMKSEYFENSDIVT